MHSWVMLAVGRVLVGAGASGGSGLIRKREFTPEHVMLHPYRADQAHSTALLRPLRPQDPPHLAGRPQRAHLVRSCTRHTRQSLARGSR